jgi:hypothetical protein
MASGNPLPQYYAATPLESAVLDGSRGIFHGFDKSPSHMYLASLGLLTTGTGLIGAFKLLDYLMYYPFIDGDDTDVQTVSNTITLERYTDGEGVMAMLVCVAPTTGGGSFTFDYVNQDGVTKTAPTQNYTTTAANIASILTSQQAVAGSVGPFLQLASGDRGIRSIVSFTNLSAAGGLSSIVLVKPLADIACREVGTLMEVEYISQRAGPPRIYDGAYLGLIANTPATMAANVLIGYANFVWN